MNRTRPASCGALLGALFVLGACGMTPMKASVPIQPMEPMPPLAAMSAPKSATAQLSGMTEVPAVMGSASGTLQGTLNPQTSVLAWTVRYVGLTGAATAAHFHGPAIAGQNAGVALPLTGSLVSPISGSVTLTAAQMADVRAGKWYLNLHTAANPSGEIRGQLTVQP